MHFLRMASKTISLRLDAYEKLKGARRYSGESFSEIVLRASWPEETVTGAELLDWYRRRGPFFTEEELNRIERGKREERAPEDKWKTV